MISRHDSAAAWWLVFLMLSATVLYTRIDVGDPLPSLDASRTFFPLKLNQWSCMPVDSNADSYRDASVDYAWVAKCWRPDDGHVLDVHIGYASGATFQSKNLSPRLNHPALDMDDRWSFIPQDQRSRPGQKADPTPSPWNQILLSHSSGPRIAVVYWYQIGDSVYSDDYRYRLALLIRRLLRRSAASQLVRISTTVKTADESPDFDALHDLAKVVAPVVRSSFNR